MHFPHLAFNQFFSVWYRLMTLRQTPASECDWRHIRSSHIQSILQESISNTSTFHQITGTIHFNPTAALGLATFAKDFYCFHNRFKSVQLGWGLVSRDIKIILIPRLGRTLGPEHDLFWSFWKKMNKVYQSVITSFANPLKTWAEKLKSRSPTTDNWFCTNVFIVCNPKSPWRITLCRS